MESYKPQNRLNQNYYQSRSNIQKLLLIELKLFNRYFCSLWVKLQNKLHKVVNAQED